MKKKIVIISIISVLLVVIGVTSYCVSRNKISNIKVSEDSILENDFIELEEKCKNIMKEKIEERQNNIEYCKKCPNEALCGKGCIALQNLNKGSYYKLDPICPNIKRTVGANNKDTALLKEA